MEEITITVAFMGPDKIIELVSVQCPVTRKTLRQRPMIIASISNVPHVTTWEDIDMPDWVD